MSLTGLPRILAGGILCLSGGGLRAQSVHRYELDLALMHALHRDASASPLRYDGAGLAASGAFSWEQWGRDSRLSLSAAYPTLESANSRDGVPRQKVIRSRGELTTLPMRKGGDRLRWGGRVYADFALNEYTPGGNEAFAFGYLFFHSGLAPVLEGDRNVGPGALHVSASVPLIGVAVRPYTNVRIIARERAEWRLMSPVSLQSYSIHATYGPRTRRRVAWRALYRGYFARYTDYPAYRAFENSFGLSVGFGRRGTAQ